MTIVINGTQEVRGELLRLVQKYPEAVGRILYREGEEIMTRSKQEFVPTDFGTLKNSGKTLRPVKRGLYSEVTMSFGGPASAYALAVHEHLSEFSPRSWRVAEAAGRPVQFSPEGRGPKYLERPLKEAVTGMTTRIAAGLKAEGLV